MKQAENQNKVLPVTLLVIYVIAVLMITLDREAGKQQLILMPFWELRQMISTERYVHWSLQIGLNILLFVPYGVLMPVIFRRFRSFWLLSGTAMLCSVLIETVQYVLARGLTETDDVMHNTCGAVIGYLVYRCLQARKQSGSNTG